MGAATKLLEKKVLRDLVPLNALSAIHLEEISRKAVIEELRPGRYLFREGDQDGHSIYVIKGKIELLDAGRQIVGYVEAESETARHPLAHKQPRQLSARAANAATVIRIDSSLLDVLLTWDESSGYDVVEIDADENQDWMTRVLQSQVFLQLPPSNIQQLLMRLDEVSLDAGETVVRQGEDGDYFYIVKHGRLAVSRKASEHTEEVVLAELGEGAFFGEEALVSGATRNASVTMITDGTLMRLSQADFNELLRVRTVHEVQFEEASQLVAHGAQWLDVRVPGEFENQALDGSRNVPLSALREQSAGLDAKVPYILCCDTGRRSAAAAFVLAQIGFHVYTLKNGLMDVPDQAFTRRDSDRVADAGQDAEIIPFGAEAKHSQRAEPTREGEIKAVAEQLQQSLRERAELERRLEQRRLEVESADSELAELRVLRDEQQREHDKKTRLLEEELKRLRKDRSRLDQRARTLAGERDSSVSERDKLRSEIGTLKDQLACQQKEAAAQNEALKRRLEAHETALASEKHAARATQQQLIELEEARAESERALREGLEREQNLRAQLKEVAQRAENAREAARSEANTAQQALHHHIAELEAELETRRRQLEEQRSELENRLEEAQQSLKATGEQVRKGEQELRDALQRIAESEREVQAAREHSEALQQTLDEREKQRADSEQRATDLEKRLSETLGEHESDVASVRDALGRAQEERENVKRDQKRLMNTLRESERKLERERQDHEAEIHRLRKELKQSVGESDAGLTAELEALQAKLKQGTRDRDELEIKLGERSAQLENLQTQVDKLTAQLADAQGAAQQMEHQLAETKKAAGEDMTIRLAAEQQRQQALLDDLQIALGERDDAKLQLAAAAREVEELREAIGAARSDLHSQPETERQIQALHAELQRVRAERDAARNAEQRFREEAGELHAEDETSRALEQLVPLPFGPAAAHEAGGETRAAEVTTIQRSENEEQLLALQNAVDFLRAQLNRVQANESPESGAAAIAMLDDAGPFGAAVHPGDSGAQPYMDAPAAQPAQLDFERPDAECAALTPMARKGGRLVKGALAAVAVALLTVGTFWWLGGPGLTVLSGMEMPMDSLIARLDGTTPVETAASQVSESGGDASETSPASSDKDAASADEAKGTVGSKVSAAQGGSVPPSAVESVRRAPSSQPGETFRDRLRSGGRGPSMVELRADRFRMGSGAASPHFDERPRHGVNVARFALSKHEITFDQYDRFAEETGRGRPPGAKRGLRPVVKVSWHDAVAYTDWLSAQTGHRYRLPTEAEWEFAARAGGITRFPWGNRVGEENANCFDCGARWSGRETAPVGSFGASAFGLHDMVGNAREWIQDCYVANYKAAPADASAVDAADCAERVIRGGSYSSPSAQLRVTARDRSEPGTRLDDLGFRVVREY